MTAEELIKNLTDMNNLSFTVTVNGREVVGVDYKLYNHTIYLELEEEKFDALDPGEYL